VSTDDGIRDLSADGIIMACGWHLSYARVVLIEQDHDDAVVLVDGNGDGAELELEYWHRDVDGLWYCGSTAGHEGLDFLSSSQSSAFTVSALSVLGPRPRSGRTVQQRHEPSCTQRLQIPALEQRQRHRPS
jgi:hypothetical protein